jgi:hypothetical protein
MVLKNVVSFLLKGALKAQRGITKCLEDFRFSGRGLLGDR